MSHYTNTPDVDRWGAGGKLFKYLSPSAAHTQLHNFVCVCVSIASPTPPPTLCVIKSKVQRNGAIIISVRVCASIVCWLLSWTARQSYVEIVEIFAVIVIINMGIAALYYAMISIGFLRVGKRICWPSVE